jgi:hypothetical protein
MPNLPLEPFRRPILNKGKQKGRLTAEQKIK